MTAAAAQLQDRTRLGARRAAVTWILLLAFALQSYVTQTHFHPGAFEPATHTSIRMAPPGGDEAGACPLCQAVASAGVFIATAAVMATALAAGFILVARAPAKAGRTATPAGFAWRSRAPPQS
jgi:hypothetical protein